MNAIDAYVNAMKAKGILSAANISLPSKGIFQTDTEEITLRAKDNLLKVATPRSEAVTLEADTAEQVGALEILGSDVPACVAACSMDGRNLKDSARMVLLYSTEVANTDMELSCDGIELKELGKLPVLMKTGRLQATLENSNNAKLNLYSLGLNGERKERLPLESINGHVKIDINTALLKDGPTTFFELSTE